MIRCYKCGFGHLTEEGLKKCKSWAEMQAEKVADIGKLDAADEKVDLSSGIPPDVWLNGGTQMCCNQACPKYSPVASITCRRCMCSVDGKLSAETGGEKAGKDWDADVKSPLDAEVNPEICAICQKSVHPHHTRGWAGHSFKPFGSGSGEPEKLNNAQKSPELRRMAQNMATYGRHLPNCRTQKPNSDGWCDCGFKDANRWALAESSLSSPPPLCTCPPMHLAPCPLSTPANYVVAPEKK